MICYTKLTPTNMFSYIFFWILVTALLIIVLGKLWGMPCVNWDICFKKIFNLYCYNFLHSSDQEELFLTAKKIGKDLSVILKRDIPEINNFFGKLSL